MAAVRESAVAGQFYPADPAVLRTTVASLLEDVGAPEGPPPKAIIAPHAGYIYSGPVAASAYALLRPHRDLYRRVVLLGPCHYVGVRGLAMSAAKFFRTPLGDIPVDHAFVEEHCDPGLTINDATHRPEHSLEVHLPFLQSVLADFTLIPIVVGDAQPDEVAAVLDQLWNGPDTLIVVSSDLSYYLPYEEARLRDSATCRSIERLQTEDIGPYDACGCHAVNGLLEVARYRHLRISTLDLRNSGDTAGPKDRVVGYGAWIFTESGRESQ
jgi:AmmeMemoRadiSam system protein B